MFLKCLFFVCVWFCSIWSLEIVGNLFFHSRWVLLSTLKFLLAAQFAKPCDISPRFKLTWRIRARQQRRRWNSWRLAAKNWKVLDDGKEAHQNGIRHFSFQQKKWCEKLLIRKNQNAKQSCPEFFRWNFTSHGFSIPENYKYKFPSKTSWYLYETPLKINGCGPKNQAIEHEKWTAAPKPPQSFMFSGMYKKYYTLYNTLLQIIIANYTYYYKLLFQITTTIANYTISNHYCKWYYSLYFQRLSWVLNFSLPPKNSRDPTVFSAKRPNVKSLRRTSVCCERRRCERMMFFGVADFYPKKTNHTIP